MIPPELASLVLRAVDDSTGVMIVGLRGATEQRLYVNDRAAEILGWRREDLETKSLGEIVAPEEVPRFAELLSGWRSGKEAPRKIEIVYLAEDGRRVPVEAIAFEVAHDEDRHIVAFYYDISDRKAMEAELRRAERMATIGTLAAGVAHEINNPMAYVMLNLEQMRMLLSAPLEATTDIEEIRDLVEASIDGCERVASITRQLLLFSRPERSPGAVDAAEALEAALKLAASTLRRVARIEKRVVAPSFVCAEERRLTQVFLNLLLNAAEALGDRRAEENVVTVDVRSDGESVVVEVSDNGPGICATNIERIFEPFFTTQPSGTGLGLAISRSIVESFGGTLEAFVLPEGGTTFRVRLARVKREEPPHVREAPSHRLASVIVIDDEPLVAAALGRMLRAKHDVSVHTSPRAALEQLIQGPAADVVVCDIVMPELNGVELYARLCEARPEYKERFIFVTGGTTTNEVSAVMAALPAPTLPKPFDMAAIESAIRDCLSRCPRVNATGGDRA